MVQGNDPNLTANMEFQSKAGFTSALQYTDAPIHFFGVSIWYLNLGMYSDVISNYFYLNVGGGGVLV